MKQGASPMATSLTNKELKIRTTSDRNTTASRLTAQQVWQAVAGASFAVVGYVTPTGEPRSSGVVYKTIGERMYSAVAPDTWKARHIAARGHVSVTVPVRRGGVLALIFPIPPATISFHATAIVHPADSPEVGSWLKELAPLLPAERGVSSTIIEVIPQGEFLTYGVGVPLMDMRNPAAAHARVPVM
jgi:pyridoxamine 5'-phosphate oxidase-like protein